MSNEDKGILEKASDTIQEGFSTAKEKVSSVMGQTEEEAKKTKHGVQADVGKEKAKDDDLSAGKRLEGGAEYVEHKVKEKFHGEKAKHQ